MIGKETRRSAAGTGAFFEYGAKVAGWVCQAGAMLLITRTRLIGEAAPFAPACMAAGVAAGANPVCLLLGCALSALLSGGGDMEWMVFLSCTLACALESGAKWLEGRNERMAGRRDALCAFSSGAGCLIAGLMFSGGTKYNLLISAVSSAASMFLAPALISGMGIRPDRKRLMPEEQLSLSLCLMLGLIGLRAAPGSGKFLAPAAATLLTLIFSGAGAGMGALCGLAAGTALTLGGSDPFMGSVMGLCGLLAGCVKKSPRIAAAIAFILGNTLTVTWGVGYTVGAVPVWPLLTGCTAYCLTPMRALERLYGWMQGGYPQSDPESIAVRLRQKAGRRLGEISEVFGALADGYGEEYELPGEQQIISKVRHALCDGCDGYADCWMGEEPRAGRLMCRMAAEALGGKEITPARELPPDLIRHCRRSGQIDKRAAPLLKQLAQTRRDALKRGEARGLIGRQFREAQRMLDSLSVQMKSGVCVNREFAAPVHGALDRAGIPVREVTVVLDDRMEIICVLKEKLWDMTSAHRAAAFMTEELGVPFSPVLTRGRVPDECELRLRQAPALTAEAAAASCAAEEGALCGDSFMAQLLPDGRLVAAISDGMGQGAQAAAESKRCISLLQKFVCAGMEKDAALNAVNSLLMLRDGEEMFATADLCVIDLYSGIAHMSKLGACRSFIVSDRDIREIAGGRLPLGILDRVEPAMENIEVQPGDLVIMFSDGIADEMKEGQMKQLRRAIERIRRKRPQQAANELLDWAKKRDEGKDADDMTVIAIRILTRRAGSAR